MQNKKTRRKFFDLTVKAVIVNEKGEILLLKRPKEDNYGAGKWDLPGGKMEEDENIKEALAREIKEEIGLEIEVGPILYVFDFEKKYDRKYEIGEEEIMIGGKGVRFLGYYKSGEIKLSKEHTECQWMEPEKALEQFGTDDFEKDKKVSIKKAMEYLELGDSLDGWKRCQADFENYKKRQQESLKDTISYANTNLILEILPVLDNFHASTDHIPKEQKDSPWVVGIMHIQSQLEKILEDNNVKEIEAKEGDKFNPEIHEAIEGEANDGKIKKILQKGYRINGKVVRAVRVIVE